jgi:hypothetical protein
MSNAAAATPLAAGFEQFGAIERPASASSFLLTDPCAIWIVKAGKLDLFLASRRDGEPAGARHPLLRVEKSEAVLECRATAKSL